MEIIKQEQEAREVLAVLEAEAEAPDTEGLLEATHEEIVEVEVEMAAMEVAAEEGEGFPEKLEAAVMAVLLALAALVVLD